MSEPEMVEVKTADLIGAALDWAVAKVSGMPFYTQGEDWPGNAKVNDQAAREAVLIRNLLGGMFHEYEGNTVPWSPSTSWTQGGPLIERFKVMITPPNDLIHRNFGPFDPRNGWCESGHWGSTIFGKVRKYRRTAFSHPDSPLIVAMRAIVQFELGDTVQIPKELMQ